MRSEDRALLSPLWRSPLLLAAAVALITVVVFLPAIRCDFVIWDDDHMVRDNIHIRSLDAEFFRWAFTDISLGLWQPGAWLSHAIDYALWGLNPAGHHLSGILLHGANTFLVFLLVLRLLEAAAGGAHSVNGAGERDRTADLVAAGVTGGLFGLHPLHVEPAVWITGRTDLISGFFSLACLILYVAYAGEGRTRSGAGPRVLVRSGRYWSSFACFSLALTGKPVSLTLPFIMLVLDWYPLQRFSSGKNRLVPLAEKLPYFAAAAAIGLLYVSGYRGAGGGAPDASAVPGLIAVALEGLFFYLGKTAVPLHLFPLYPSPENVSLLSARSWCLLLTALGVTAYCVGMMRRRPVLTAAWASFLLALLPTLGLGGVRNSFAADRYMYLPSLSLFLLAGLAAAQAVRYLRSLPGRPALKSAFAAVLLVLGTAMAATTVRQISFWKSSVSLWSNVIRHEPLRIPIAYNNRGLAYREQGRFDLAVEDYTIALSLAPGAKTLTNRGIVYAESGQLDLAQKDFNAALALDASYADAYTSRGLLLAKAGSHGAALTDLDKAISLKPESADAWLNRGVALEQGGDLEGAAADYTRAIQLDPTDYLAYVDRGMVYARLGNSARAIEDLSRALSLKPDHAEAYVERGNSLRAAGDMARAGDDYRKACDLGSQAGCEAAHSRRQR